MTVLETLEISSDGHNTRYVTAVTQTTIKAVDSHGYPHYYDRYSGKLKLSPQSSQTIGDGKLSALRQIEQYIFRHGYSPFALGRFTWNGGLRSYLNADNTINPQWKRADGSSIDIKAIKGLKIKKMKFNL